MLPRWTATPTGALFIFVELEMLHPAQTVSADVPVSFAYGGREFRVALQRNRAGKRRNRYLPALTVRIDWMEPLLDCH